MSFRGNVRSEACCVTCCKSQKQQQQQQARSSEEVLVVDFSNWLNVVDENILQSQTERFERVSLVLKDVSRIDPSVLLLLEKYVGQKIVELRVEDCGELSWNNEFRVLLANCRGLEILSLKNMKWIDDYVMEQISVKFHRTLHTIEFENLSSITNTTFYQLGRRCSGIRTLKLLCCPTINDFGIFEINKKNHLESIYVSHNLSVSDKSIENLLSQSRQLKSISFINCPNMSDSSLGALYEAVVSWGKQRNMEAATVKSIELRDNYSFTYQVMIFISAQIPGLEKLDIRDCGALDLVRGMHEMARCTKITELKLGGDISGNGRHFYRVDPDKFLTAMLVFAPQLKTLHLEGIVDFDDDHIAALMDETLELRDLTLINMHFGTQTVEAICSNNPNISKIEFTGSRILADMDMRCLTTICVHITALKVHRCEKLTDSAFARCVRLGILDELDLSYVSKQCTQAALKYFTLCSLRSLALDGLPVSIKAVFPFLISSNFTSLRVVSLKGCSALDKDGLEYFLKHFLRCRELDLTDCNLSVKDVRACNIIESDVGDRGADIINPAVADALSASISIVEERESAGTSTKDFKNSKRRFSKKENKRKITSGTSKKMSSTAPPLSGRAPGPAKEGSSATVKGRFVHPFLRFHMSESGDFMGYKLTTAGGDLALAAASAEVDKVDPDPTSIVDEKMLSEEGKVAGGLTPTKALLTRSSSSSNDVIRGKTAATSDGSTLICSKSRRSTSVNAIPFDLNLLLGADSVNTAEAFGGTRNVYQQFWSTSLQLRRHYGAKLMQRLRRKYNIRVEELKNMRRNNWNDFKMTRAVLIQCAIRRFLAQKRTRPIMAAGRRISRMGQDWHCYRDYLKSKLAKRHYLLRLRVTSVQKLSLFRKQSKLTLQEKEEKLRRLHLNRVLRWYHSKLLELEIEWRDDRFAQTANVVYEMVKLKEIMDHWKTVLYETSNRKQALVRVFMQAIPLYTHNSFRQRALVAQAVHFRDRVVIMPAWLSFCQDLLEIKRVRALVPLAAEHFEKQFFKRVVAGCFAALNLYRHARRFKKKAKLRGIAGWERYNKMIGGRKLSDRAQYRLKEKATMRSVLNVWNLHHTKLGMRNRFPLFTIQTIWHKAKYTGAKDHFNEFITKHGFKDLIAGAIRLKAYNRLNKMAERKRDEFRCKRVWGGLVLWKQYSRNLGALYYRKYVMKIARKVLFGFQLNAALRKDMTQRLVKHIRHKTNYDDNKFAMIMKAICKFQAIPKGKFVRNQWAETKIEKLYSIQMLQNFFRVYLARKEYWKRYRKQILKETVNEDIELDRMRDADAESQYYEYLIRKIIDIQRCFRGWIGRQVAYVRKVENFQSKIRDFTAENERVRDNHENFMRQKMALEHRRQDSATLLQKRLRGMFARKAFIEVKRLALTAKLAVLVQRQYRRRLAQLKLRALKRDYIYTDRHRSARKQRGMLLRLFGFRKRKTQAVLGKVLDALGIDPLTYNYRLPELIQETINDFHQMKNILFREKALYEEHGRNVVNRTMGRRRWVADEGFKFKLHDTVRIAEAGHQFAGLTGEIVRIDPNVLGLPLYEVKLDRYFDRQTFVRMTTDPLAIYDVSGQALARIQQRPTLPDRLVRELTQNEVYGVIEGTTHKEVKAAWIIQCAFRQHRARKIVSRRRYEQWMRASDRQSNLLNTLAETNTITFQANVLTGLLGLRSKKPTKFDEIRHGLVPMRYFNSKGLVETKVIKNEYDLKQKDRQKYLQKCAIIAGKQYFALGYERMTKKRKLGLLFNMMCGKTPKPNARSKDLRGARGAQGVRAMKKALVTGTDMYQFGQFRGSPHVRYYKTSLFQGEWTGIPVFQSLKPHGEGVIVFLDGWGFAKEDKVLYLTIEKARYLNAMDLDTSDPFCDIFCNNYNVQSSVVWKNLNPDWYEKFEIDVTNPYAEINIQVKDKDYLGADDFMGQISLKISELADGKEKTFTMLLKGEDMSIDEGFDRGELTFKAQWSERLSEEDQDKVKARLRMATRLQAWARRIAAQTALKFLRKEREQLMVMIKAKAIKITNTCRIRLATKEARRRRRFIHAAIKLQKRVRVWIARKVFKKRKLLWYKAIIIQTLMRVYLAKAAVQRIKDAIKSDLDRSATIIQRRMRYVLAVMTMDALRLEAGKHLNIQLDEDAMSLADSVGSEDTLAREIRKARLNIPDPVSSWINEYGVDPEYGLKRNRRITNRIFARMLKTKFVKIVSRFGLVLVDSYPPRKSEEELLLEMQGNAHDEAARAAAGGLVTLTKRESFVSVYLPPFDPRYKKRKPAVELVQKYEHLAIMNLDDSIDLRKSVEYTVIVLQCFVRCKQAQKQYAKMLTVHKAIAKFQRIFRRRFENYHKAAIKIASLFRILGARRVVRFVRTEYQSACRLQRAWRCYDARGKLFDLLCVEKLSVLKYSSAIDFHGAEKALEHRPDTFWITDSPEIAEVRVEFAKRENICQVWVQTSTYTASPSFISIFAMEKKDAYTCLFNKVTLPFLPERRWHTFVLENLITTKYFKVVFYDNYGDDRHIAVRQIRFLRTKEASSHIEVQPHHHILDKGPSIGDTGEILLKVVASGWPPPTYQWFNRDVMIPGATSPELKLSLHCMENTRYRGFRCIKCKMISKEVPFNAFHVECGNCAHKFAYKEIEDYDKDIVRIKEEERVLHVEQKALTDAILQTKSYNNVKYQQLLDDLYERSDEVEEKLQALRERRITLKDTVGTCNKFTNEGIFQCHVTNVRGGDMKVVCKSIRTVVVVEHSIPYVLKVVPVYFPMKRFARKKWNIYSSIRGFCNHGALEGIVTIRYIDGSYYEGPYVPETAIDAMGGVLGSMRIKNHYGIYTCSDGRVFEGVLVDNHFDQNNLQQAYKLTLPNKEVYEGTFCDQQFHGYGMYTYKDGSVYEGHWHCGTRFGHGHHRSSEGWTYEGFYDTDRRHRDGIITWPDGSCYMGEWYFEKIQGRGVLISPLRDVYKGQLVDGIPNGNGEMLYANGSMYVGVFKNGLRHGKGIFTEREGNEYFGHFVNDVKEGEHIVKVVIPIQEVGQDNYEVRVGVYLKGKLQTWKMKLSNPIATRQFIAMFKGNRDMFDSVYSMILAKNLPNLPEGIDSNNEDVKAIIFKIRNEAGMLVGQQALLQAQQQVKILFKPIKDKTAEVDKLKADVEKYSMKIIELERDANSNWIKYTNFISAYEKDTAQIAQFWTDEPTEVRARFNKACENLKLLTVEELFAFRNHRVVPVFVKKIFDAISYLLDISDEWAVQQFIVADAVACSRAEDDPDAMQHNYTMKLVHLMKSYKVYNYIHIKKRKELIDILVDPRFRADSYYIESTGPPGKYLVEWIKINYQYLQAAHKQYDILNAAEEKKLSAYRYKAAHAKKKEEIAEIGTFLEYSRKLLKSASLELEDLQHALLKAQELLDFISGRSQLNTSTGKEDYYKLMDQKIESRKDHFSVEVCLENAIATMIDNMERERKLKASEAAARGITLEDMQQGRQLITDWILEEVLAQQAGVFERGMTLGYALEVEENALTEAQTTNIVSLVADIVVGKLNDTLNDMAAARSWLTLKGRRFTSRFLYIITWKVWKEQAIKIRDDAAVAAWEEIWGDMHTCALKAIEARSSHRMSTVAREQAKIWEKRADHREAVRVAEIELSDAFEYEVYDETGAKTTAQTALEMQDQMLLDGDSVNPAQRARCLAWSRLHPEEMNVARDAKNLGLAEQFEENFGPGNKAQTAEVCYKILHNWALPDEMEWIEYADHWKSFNMDAYKAAGDALLKEMSAEFSELQPLNTFLEAVKMIDNNAVAQFIEDEEVRKEYEADARILLLANSWATLHQGLIRKARYLYRIEQQTMERAQWGEFEDQTVNFTKGSALLAGNAVGSEADRFVGFRARIQAKCAWVYGYLLFRQAQLLEELEKLNHNDPIHKVMHRVRPSEREKVMHRIEEEFLAERKQVENDLSVVVDKLSKWHTYFGMTQHYTEYHDPYAQF